MHEGHEGHDGQDAARDAHARRGRLRYGTSSWSEKSWAGVFYPDGMAPGDYLAHYATQFDAVEADVTYYRVPDARLVDGWRHKTPAGFMLAAKFPGSITHGGKGEAKPDATRVLNLDVVGEDLERFLSAMDRLGDRCGPLVLQFPYFNKSAFTSAGPFLDRLDAFLRALPPRFRYAVEVRNKAWLGEPLLAILRAHRVALVLVDLVYMPRPEELAETLDVFTTDFTYVRLIGDRKAVEAVTTTFDRVVVDQEQRLQRIARLLRVALARLPVVLTFANNHYAGHAPTTIRRLVEIVEAPE